MEKVKMQNAKWDSTIIKMRDEPLELTRFSCAPCLTSFCILHFAFCNSHFAFCIHFHDSKIKSLFILDVSRARAPRPVLVHLDGAPVPAYVINEIATAAVPPHSAP
jgi:hypothetical protein